MVQVNLKMGAGMGAGARNVLHQPREHPFQSRDLKYMNSKYYSNPYIITVHSYIYCGRILEMVPNHTSNSVYF